MLNFTVLSQRAFDSADIVIGLPSNLRFSGAPTGMQVSRAPEGHPAGPSTEAVQRRALHADQVQHFQATVEAVSKGTAEVAVSAIAPTDYGSEVGEDLIHLTVGATPATSKLGISVPETIPATPRDVRGSPVARAPASGASVGTAGFPEPFTDDPEPPAGASVPENPGTACVTGRWRYQDQLGTVRGVGNFQVQAWDHDHTFVDPDDLLGTTTTAKDGSYTICFDNSDGFPDSGTVDLYVVFVSENSLWKVQTFGLVPSNYTFSTFSGHPHDIPDGTTNLGDLFPGDPALDRALHAFDEMDDAWLAQQPQFCWRAGASPCRQMTMRWAPDSTHATHWHTGLSDTCLCFDEGHLDANDPDGPHVVVHELGHGVMDFVYEDNFPAAPNCSPHSIQGASSQGCAWTEGWAEWYPVHFVYNGGTWVFDTGGTVNLETPTWNSFGTTNNGDATEGFVAAALIDISDFSNENFWDFFGEGRSTSAGIWSTFQNNNSNTYSEFWQHRGASGFNVSNSGANGSNFQSTIDYGFRNPLSNYAELIRPTPAPSGGFPPPLHNYSYNTTVNFWSAVAIRPPVGADYDMTLFDDFGQTVPLGTSAAGGNTIDFVAVDSNVRSLGDYFPRVFQFAGSGNYLVELAQGTAIAAPGRGEAAGSSKDAPPGSSPENPGTSTIFMGTNDIVRVFDFFATVGTPIFARVVPATGGQDAELFLMESSSSSSSWVQGRFGAVRTASVGGPGAEESLNYTVPPGANGWHGIVLTNKAGSGNYTLYADTTAPSGSVAINGGAAATNSTAATLTLGASDPQTGIKDMQISTDGVFDTEPFVPFSSSASVTLPSGDGTKTVFVRYRNNALMTSGVVSDTIFLDTVAPGVVTVAGPGFAKSLSVAISWSSTDPSPSSGLKDFTVRKRVASTTSGFGSFTTILTNTTLTGTTISGAPGETVCVSASARDNALNAGPFGPERCIGFPIDDPALTASAGWTRVSGASGYFGNTFSQATGSGRRLTSGTVTTRRFSVLVAKGPGFGTIQIRWNGVLKATVNLSNASLLKKQYVGTTDLGSVQTGVLEIRVSSSGLVVQIDGVAFRRK